MNLYEIVILVAYFTQFTVRWSTYIGYMYQLTLYKKITIYPTVANFL